MWLFAQELWILKTAQHLGMGLKLLPACEVMAELAKRWVCGEGWCISAFDITACVLDAVCCVYAGCNALHVQPYSACTVCLLLHARVNPQLCGVLQS